MNRCFKGVSVHCVKSVCMGFPGLYFPAFGLNTENYKVNLRIQSEYKKMRTRKTPNMDTFYTVVFFKANYFIKSWLNLFNGRRNVKNFKLIKGSNTIVIEFAQKLSQISIKSINNLLKSQY